MTMNAIPTTTSGTTTPGSTTPTDAAVADQPLFREAFDRHLAAMMALPADSVQSVNLDIPSAVTTTLGAWGEIKAMRPLLERELPSFDLASFDRLEEYAMATGHAHLAYLSSNVSVEALPALHARAQELRELFLSDVQALVRRGLVPASQVTGFKGLVGYKNVAFDLLGLVGVLRGHWPRIQARTGIEAAELDEAERLGQLLLRAVGEREQGPAASAEATQLRQRAFTLFLRTYDATRRAISYLRWEQDDADSIIPPLYAGRPRKSRSPESSGKTPEPSPMPTPTAPPGPTNPAPTGPANLAPGQPGGSPFLY